MKKFVLAPFLAALAMFVWGFVYWGLPHGLPYKALGPVEDPSATALALGKMFPLSGAYLIPNPMLGEAKMQELALRGPMVEVHITNEPMTPAVQAKCMALGFVHVFALCLLLTIILNMLTKAWVCWTCPVKFCAALGLLVATCDLGQAIWWHHALSWTVAHAFYDFVEFVVAGLVLAKFVMPKAATEAPESP